MKEYFKKIRWCDVIVFEIEFGEFVGIEVEVLVKIILYRKDCFIVIWCMIEEENWF